ncbi:hypothetical protein F4808DRAFT_474880 [Astrocystis sublimbata]|nr:hypothetical protein F4808DRAFT_474880 [Astrocystis sublimbata]
MNEVVAQVLEDVRRRRIEFPAWDALHVPLRSSTTGDLIIEGKNSQSLLETMLASIFIEVCDWKRTRASLFNKAIKYLRYDDVARYRLLCHGPGTRSLLQGAPTHDRLSVISTPGELLENDTQDLIAIVGMSINFPGASSLEQLWEVLEKAQCTASKIPSSRFDTSTTLSDRLGNFLDDPFQFDSSFFNISPREAKSMDPQQRLLLQAALEALEDSGYSPNSTPTFQEDKFGVFVGVATNDYVDNLRDDIDVYYTPGTLRSFLSGRVSYAFHLLGPSIVVDTACSSSLVALNQACQALRSGECTVALAGGVNTISSTDMYNGLARAHFLSPTGQCKPFDAAADGYCRAEGCGLVVVKKLSSAIKENDHIYGVIRGVGVNQCGTAKSITHPDHRTQAALFSGLLEKSRTAASSVSLVEAHGTGTQAGDYAEILSLTNTFGPRSDSNPLHVSSIKGNIGHAEAASGMAGVAKLLAIIQKGQIPPQASFKSLNPKIAERARNVVIPTQLTPWERPSTQSPRRAMLCNFGAAGSNAALVLEEYIQKPRGNPKVQRSIPPRSYHVLNLSAKSEKALQQLKENFTAYIESHAELDIMDLCYTMNARRQAHDGFRLTAVGSTLSQLVASLRQSTILQSEFAKDLNRKTIFVFSGQGHVRKGMGAELLHTVPEIRAIVDECDDILTNHEFPLVGPFILDSSISDENRNANDDIIITQCALFVLELCLSRLWSKWGLLPDVVVGHSIGEYAAMTIAGMLEMKDALLLIARRARLIVTKCQPGKSSMVACRTTVDEIEAVLTGDDARYSGINIACINSPEDIVVAGPIESLINYVEYCKTKGIKAKQLDVPYGFHSSYMDPIMGDFKICVSNVDLRNSRLGFGSSLYGNILNANESLQRDYLPQQTRDSVKFHLVIEKIQREFPDSSLQFVEIGPSPSSESMIRNIIKDRPYTFLPSLKPKESAWKTLSHSLSNLFLRHYPLKWREVYDGSPARFLNYLPKYPLNTSRYFVPYRHYSAKTDGVASPPAKPQFEFVGYTEPEQSKHTDEFGFDTSFKLLAPYIKAHSVAGVPLCPASVLVEVALEAHSLSKSRPSTSPHLLADIAFEKPLVYTEQMNSRLALRTELDMSPDSETRFSISSNGQQHCSGVFARRSTNEVADMLTRKTAHAKRHRRILTQYPGAAFDVFSSKIIYQVIFPRVVTYDDPFLTLKQLTISETRLEACGTMDVDSSFLSRRFVCHPAIIDTLLHAPGFVANLYVPSDVACICVGIEHVYMPALEDLKEGEVTIYCALTDLGHSVIAEAYMISSEGNVLAYVEGACFKKIPLSSFNNHLSRTLKASAHSPSFNPSPPELILDSSSSDADDSGPLTLVNSVGGISTLGDLFLDTCGIEVEPSTMGVALGTLGVDSLLSIELSDELTKRLGVVIDESQYSISELTFNQLQEIVSGNALSSKKVAGSLDLQANTMAAMPKTTVLTPREDQDIERIIQRQNHGPLKCNTYLFHDGSGYCSFYSRMSNMNRSITGIFSPDQSIVIDRLEDLASLYIKRTKLDSDQEIILGGWSFGGVLAFEVSRQLQALGRRVKGLILIDSPPPVEHQALPPEVISYILTNKISNDKTYVTESSKQAREKIKQKFEHHAMLLQNYHPERRSRSVPCVMLKCSRSMDTELLCNITYPWVSNSDFREQSVSQWEQLMGRSIPVLDIACDHFQIFDTEHVGDVSHKLRVACEMLENASL